MNQLFIKLAIGVLSFGSLAHAADTFTEISHLMYQGQRIANGDLFAKRVTLNCEVYLYGETVKLVPLTLQSVGNLIVNYTKEETSPSYYRVPFSIPDFWPNFSTKMERKEGEAISVSAPGSINAGDYLVMRKLNENTFILEESSSTQYSNSSNSIAGSSLPWAYAYWVCRK